MEIKQGTRDPMASASLVTGAGSNGANMAHFAGNARVLTTWQGQITQTSPGVIVGIGGDTSNYLPSGAIPTGIRYYVNRGANTAATITIGIDTTSTYFMSAAAVNVNGQVIPTTKALNLFQALAQVPVGMAHTVTGYYSETATSNSNTVVTVEIDYIKPDPA